MVVHRATPGPDEVHVWWIDLAKMPQDASAELSRDERDRANRFRRPDDRGRWISARAALRQILADYLGESPAHVAFDRGNVGAASRCPTDDSHDNDLVVPRHFAPGAMEEGKGGLGALSAKPALANDSRLQFNLAHAGDRAVLAVAWEREVGIDLEPVDAKLDLPPLLTATCTASEITRIDALPPQQQFQAFLAHWTVKEAYLKAIGIGVFREPRTLEVEFLADGRIVIHDAQEVAPARWDVRLLDAGVGWVAALAVASAKYHVCPFTWPLPRHAAP